MNSILTYLLNNKRILAYVCALLSVLWTGWWVRGVYEDHRRLSDLKRTQEQLAAAEQLVHRQATEYEQFKVTSNTAILTIKQQLRAAHAKDPSRVNCPVGPDGVRAINR